jgi:hypothetical protein
VVMSFNQVCVCRHTSTFLSDSDGRVFLCQPPRMLKKSASGVLGSSKSSTYSRGYASGFDSPAALLGGLFEHPA